jgi:hypothetical protein
MKSILTVLLLLTGFALSAQRSSPRTFPDTVPLNVSRFSFTMRPDTLRGDTLFSALKSGYYVLSLQNEDRTTITLVKKEGLSWKLLLLCSASRGDTITIDTMDFNGEGTPELLVKHREYFFGQGAHGYTKEWSSRCLLWDIDRNTLIYSIDDHYRFEQFTSFEGGTYYCEIYDVVFSKGVIQLSCPPGCNLANNYNDDELVVPVKNCRYVLEYGRLVLEEL